MILNIITPYIRMLDTDWLIAMIFLFTNSGLALWICRIFTSCRCICLRFNFFSWYLQNRICRFYPSPRRLYHAWEGYLRKIPVERRNSSRAERRVKFSLKTGIFRKYPYQTWYICLITQNINNDLRCEVDIDGIVDQHCLSFIFIKPKFLTSFENNVYCSADRRQC
jgi:hypothetical protein